MREDDFSHKVNITSRSATGAGHSEAKATNAAAAAAAPKCVDLWQFFCSCHARVCYQSEEGFCSGTFNVNLVARQGLLSELKRDSALGHSTPTWSRSLGRPQRRSMNVMSLRSCTRVPAKKENTPAMAVQRHTFGRSDTYAKT